MDQRRSDPSTHRSSSESDRQHPQEEATTHSPSTVSFEWAGIRAGFYTCLPVALGVAGYGLAFGVLADQAGLSLAEAALMSATVLAGASQIVAVELWAEPIPVLTIGLAVFAINLRYSLMGAALRPWFRFLSAKQAYGSLFFMADENWALTIRDLTSGSGRGAFLLGTGIAMWTLWVVSTIVGVTIGGLIDDPARFGLDFVLVAAFIALAVELWDGSGSALPWGIALGVALATSHLLSGQWHVLAGGAAAAIVEVLRYE